MSPTFFSLTALTTVRSYDALKRQGLKEERVLLLEAWRDAESAALERGAPEDATPSREHLAAVEAKFPRKIKMKRTVGEGEAEEQEEYYDYVFPDDEKKLGECYPRHTPPCHCAATHHLSLSPCSPQWA